MLIMLLFQHNIGCNVDALARSHGLLLCHFVSLLIQNKNVEVNLF